MQWKDVDCPTYTEICNSTIINWSDCSHSFSGIQTVCLWQTMCILERQLLISIMQNQHSSYSLSSSRNTDESSLGSVTFSWQCTSAQVIGCSASTAASCPQSRLGSQWLFSYMKSEVPSSWNPVYNKKQQQPVNGRLSGTTRVGRYQKKHSPAHTHPGQRTSFITFLHLQLSMASSLFSLRAWQSSRTTSFQVLFGLLLGLEPSTSYSMHFFTQSSSSFCSTCPYAQGTTITLWSNMANQIFYKFRQNTYSHIVRKHLYLWMISIEQQQQGLSSTNCDKLQ